MNTKTCGKILEVFSGKLAQEDEVYDGVIHEGVIIHKQLYAKDFQCIRCEGNSAYICPDGSHPSKMQYFLCCADKACMKINAQRSKEKQRKERCFYPHQFNIPEMYCSAKFQNIDAKIRKQLKEFIAHPSGFVIFSGEPGRGKTYCACAVLVEIMQSNQNIYFSNYTDIYQEYLIKLKEKSNELDLLVKLQSFQTLVIDDFALRAPPEGFANFMFMLLNKRYANKNFGTILTMNTSAEKIEHFFGSSLLSRISSGIAIKFTGPDRRRGK